MSRLPQLLGTSEVAVVATGPVVAAQSIMEEFSLQLERGELGCLAGRSESGKTSILRALGRFQAIDAGDIRWAGRSILGLNARQLAEFRRRHCGFLDQDADVLGELSVAENVLLAAPDRRRKARSVALAHARELLDLVGLPGLENQLASSLSGGERTRVALARTLLAEPEMILLDEPTSGLDRGTADGIIGLLADVADAGHAILVTSHDPHLIDAARWRISLES